MVKYTKLKVTLVFLLAASSMAPLRVKLRVGSLPFAISLPFRPRPLCKQEIDNDSQLCNENKKLHICVAKDTYIYFSLRKERDKATRKDDRVEEVQY